MPEIHPYTSEQTIAPTELGVSALTQSAIRANRAATEAAAAQEQSGRQLASGISSTIRDVGADVVQYQDYQDRSKVSTAAMSGLAKAETSLQTLLKGNGKDPSDPDYIPPADPNNPAVMEKYQKDTIQPLMDNLKKIPIGEAGQKYAQELSDRLGLHLQTQARAVSMNLAAQGSVLRTVQTRNAAASMVEEVPTPDNIDFAIKHLLDAGEINKSGGSMSAEAAATLDAYTQESIQHVVHTGIASAVMKASDPEATAADLLKRYSKYVTPEEQTTITKAAETVSKARIADQKAQRIEAQNAQKDAAYARTSEYVKQFSNDPEHFTIDRMMNDKAYLDRPDLLKEGVEVINTLRKIRETMADVDPFQSRSNALSLLQRMDLPEGDPRRLTDRSELDQAFIHKDIAKTEWTELTARLEKDAGGVDKHLNETRARFFTDNAAAIDGAGKGSTPAGKQAIFAARQEAERQENFLRAQNKDPASLYDPASPNYFGKQIGRFATTSAGKLVNPDSTYQMQNPDLQQMSSVIKNNLESGGDYEAVGKEVTYPNGGKDKAYGAYQVMGQNVGPWTKKWYGRTLSPQEFLQNKEAQDMVFEGQFGLYNQKYGAEGAARAWYAGEEGMKNAAWTDVNKKLTVEQYGRKFMAGVQGLPYVDATMSPAEVRNKYGQSRPVKVMRSDGSIWTIPAISAPESK